ncbi:DNA-directed RNA polymerase II RPB9 [Toxoplasma gondii CAST]|uniref:DNA-directed RNA polymerase II RPB9 n=1 Tax=Toxoplasma gondii CAST TaxID=943122 RepID=A0A425I3D7_TOXGO|nr:DNA-directed RNA polymerase II RPB9 [Toxoplasma gondii CAST]
MLIMVDMRGWLREEGMSEDEEAPQGAPFRLHEAKVEEDESSVAGALEAGALSVKRAAAEAQDEDREAEFGDAPLGGEVEEDDDLFGEREEEEILESQDAFDEDDPYTHRLEPQDGSVGELDVTFD